MRPFVSSDPSVWMRPYYAELSRRPGFATLAPALKFRALVDAIAQDQPIRAAEMRDSNATTQSAILGWLADVTSQKPALREMELWRVRKGERELRCIAAYLPTSIDLRLMEGDEFRRAQLCLDARTLHAISAGLARQFGPGRTGICVGRSWQAGLVLGNRNTPDDERQSRALESLG